MADHDHDDPQQGFLSQTDQHTHGRGAEDLPTLGIQRVSRKWNSENPFKASADWTTKGSNDYGPTGHKSPYGSQGDESAGPDGGDEFSEVALASVPGNRTVYTNSGSGPTSTGEESGGMSGNDGLPVVVANAECKLEHPRPSRRSERERIKALCKEEVEDSEDLQGSRRKSGVSGGSSASYHTAPVSISVP